MSGKRGLAFIAPLLVLLLVVFALPVFEIIRRSFVVDGALSLEHYEKLFGTAVFWTILLRTFAVAIGTTLVCVLLAYPYAYLMTIVSPRTRSLMMLVVLIPFWTSLMVRTYSWLVLLQDTGPVVGFLRGLGFEELTLIRTTVGVMIGMIQILLPFMVLPLYNTLATVDRRLLGAASILGARPFRAFGRVYLPLSLPGVFAGGVLVFILSLGFYITPVILGSPKNSLISQLIVQRVSDQLDWGGGGAMSLVLFLLTILVVALSSRAVNVSRVYGSAA